MNFNQTSIVSVKGNEYRIHFCYVSRDKAINIMKKPDLRKKSGLLQNFSYFYFFYYAYNFFK